MEDMKTPIEAARLVRGITQAEAAKVIGVSRPTYAAIETGKNDLTLRQAEVLAAMYRVTIDELRGAADGVSVYTDESVISEKYKQMVLNALCYGADGDGRITKTKLAKLVYLADFVWYYEHLEPMSGVRYRKLPQGPVADVYFRVLDELEEEGVVKRVTKGHAFFYELVETEAPTNRLTEGEAEMIKNISESWRGKATGEIVDFTHEQLPWQICRDGEVIPYGLITQEEPERVYGGTKLHR